MTSINVAEMKNEYLKFVAEEKEKFGKKWSKPIQWAVTAFNLVIALMVIFLFFFEQIDLLIVGFLFALGYALASVTAGILIWISQKTVRSALLGLASLVPFSLIVLAWIGLACYVISLSGTIGLLMLSVPIVFGAPILLEKVVSKVAGENAKFTITEVQHNEGWIAAEANEALNKAFHQAEAKKNEERWQAEAYNDFIENARIRRIIFELAKELLPELGARLVIDLPYWAEIPDREMPVEKKSAE